MPDESTPETTTPTYRPPDAILVDRDYPSGGNDIEKHQRRNAIFGPAFGCARVQSGHAGLSGAGFTKSLVRPVGADTSLGRYHGSYHPEAGRDRFAWFVARKEGAGKAAKFVPVIPLMEGEAEPAGEILFGYLKPDPHARDEAVAHATKKDLDERIAMAREDREARAQLAALEQAPREVAPVVLPEQIDTTNSSTPKKSSKS